MHEDILTKLKAERDALDRRIADHKPLAYSVAVDKIRAYVTEHGMTEADLFPAPFDATADPVPDAQPIRDFSRTPFSDFRYEDTLGYTFIGDLKEQRYELDRRLRAIQREAVKRARNFIHEYDLAKEDIFHAPGQEAK